jgi:hypothetical protein
LSSGASWRLGPSGPGDVARRSRVQVTAQAIIWALGSRRKPVRPSRCRESRGFHSLLAGCQSATINSPEGFLAFPRGTAACMPGYPSHGHDETGYRRARVLRLALQRFRRAGARQPAHHESQTCAHREILAAGPVLLPSRRARTRGSPLEDPTPQILRSALRIGRNSIAALSLPYKIPVGMCGHGRASGRRGREWGRRIPAAGRIRMDQRCSG